jgi:hypothetical protein
MPETEPSGGPEPSEREPLLSPTERHEILDREIRELMRAGLRLVSQFHYVALLSRPESGEFVELHVDGHGRVRHT